MYDFTQLFVYKIIFMIELLVAMHLFAFRMKKKNHYLLRTSISSLLLIGLAAAFPLYSYSAWYTSLMFLILFFIAMASMIFIYDVSFKQIFFFSVAGYTSQHFAHELYSLLGTITSLVTSSTLGMYGDIPFDLDLSSPTTYFVALVYIESYLLSYWILYKLFGKKINQEDVKINNFSIALIASCILLVDIILNAVTVYINAGYNKTYVIVESIYNLICCLLILYIQVAMCIQKKLENDVDTLSLLLHQSEEQYKQSDENIKLLNLKCHDLKHQIREYTEKREIDSKYVNELVDLINIYDSNVKTGNDALDLILTEKSLLCHKNQINITCLADCSKLNYLSNSELYSLFGNIIDNAIEATMKINNPAKREISLIVKNVSGFISIDLENYFEGTISLDDDGLPITTKGDKNYHGYGLKSTLMIVNKYKGDMHVKIDNQIFSLSILLPNIINN